MQLKLPRRLQQLKMVAALSNFLTTPESLNNILHVAKSVNDAPQGEPAPRQLLTDNHFKVLVEEEWGPAQIEQQNPQTPAEGSLEHRYADQQISQEITPDALIDPTPVTKTNEFIVQRVREHHLIVYGLKEFECDGESKRGLEGLNLTRTIPSGHNSDIWGNAQQPSKRWSTSSRAQSPSPKS